MSPLLSTLPFLALGQAMFLLACARTAGGPATAWTLVPVLVALFAWGILSGWFAVTGVYDDTSVLASFPGFWLPLVPIIIVVAFLAIPAVRRAILTTVDSVPAYWLTGIHILRIAALGTLVKTALGEFPLQVELAIGLTDLAYGLSALWITRLAAGGRISEDALVVWHLVGVALIVVPGMITIQYSLPGPMQVFDGAQSAEVMLDYPMVLGPSLVVPVFLMFNLLGALAAYRQARRAVPAPAA